MQIPSGYLTGSGDCLTAGPALARQFLNKMGGDAGAVEKFKMGSEWDTKGTTAQRCRCIYLKKQDVSVEVTGKMGMSNTASAPTGLAVTRDSQGTTGVSQHQGVQVINVY